MEIDSTDVVRLMLQFMKENNLSDSMKALQTETGVALNTVDSIETFSSDIVNGKWDVVLANVSQLSISKEKLVSLYEQVVFELLEGGERELAKEMVRGTEPLTSLRSEQPERYLKLEHLCQRPFFNATDAYEMGSSKEKRRYEIADSFASEVTIVPPSRLLVLMGQALKHQQSQGLLPKGAAFDLFRGGKRIAQKDAEDKVPKKLAGQIKFAVESHPEMAIFSPDGQSLVTGSFDGFVEVWDPETCQLRQDLEYQTKDELMMHEDAVLCGCFSKDGDFLATGSHSGQIKVWKLTTGACMRKYQAHSQGLTSLQFTKDNSQLLSTSYDGTARIHGIKSGKTLKELRGHKSFVNGAAFVKDGNQAITVSSDGWAIVWDLKTAEALHTFRPGEIPGEVMRDISLTCVLPLPQHNDQVIICSRSPTAYLVTLQGHLLRTFSSGKATGGEFVSAALSPQGKWLFCAGEDGILYVFDVQSGQIEHVFQLSDDGSEVIGVFQHPHRNLVGTITDRGLLKLWKP